MLVENDEVQHRLKKKTQMSCLKFDLLQKSKGNFHLLAQDKERVQLLYVAAARHSTTLQQSFYIVQINRNHIISGV